VTRDPVDLIARTVLYEGYLLYPYRPSAVKNRQRFNFGVLYPNEYCDQGSNDRSRIQVECPVLGTPETRFDLEVRFLQLVEQPREDGAEPWHVAVEREVRLEVPRLSDVPAGLEFGFPRVDPVQIDGHTPADSPCGSSGAAVIGEIRAALDEVRPGVYRLTVRVANLTSIGAGATRDQALVRSLASAHVVIRISKGELVSLLDPPDRLREVAGSCLNVGVWPVLVGVEGSANCMLASAITLYDYPQVAPESPGDLFDGTEIDEILALRVLTMTDDEKREARGSDERAREILDRTDALTPEHWARLHGTLRGLRKATGAAR
jgi:hypothetical protein